MATMPPVVDTVDATGQEPGTAEARAGVRLGLRANLAQFGLLVAVNALVGGVLGQERVVVPLLAQRVFGLAAFTSALTFIVAFGAVKRSPTSSPVPCPTGTAAGPC